MVFGEVRMVGGWEGKGGAGLEGERFVLAESCLCRALQYQYRDGLLWIGREAAY